MAVPEHDRAGLGRVIVLNGTSSSGKTTLASKLQARLAAAGECWMLISTDVMFPLLPRSFFAYGPRAVGDHAADGLSFQVVEGRLERSSGSVGQKVFDAYRSWIVGTARAGLNVIVDEVLLTEADWSELKAALAGLDVHWVGIEIGLEPLEARERVRGDRVIGLARSQFDLVHRHAIYDTMVDTASLDPDAAADVILAAVGSSA